MTLTSNQPRPPPLIGRVMRVCSKIPPVDSIKFLLARREPAVRITARRESSLCLCERRKDLLYSPRTSRKALVTASSPVAKFTDTVASQSRGLQTSPLCTRSLFQQDWSDLCRIQSQSTAPRGEPYTSSSTRTSCTHWTSRIRLVATKGLHRQEREFEYKLHNAY